MACVLRPPGPRRRAARALLAVLALLALSVPGRARQELGPPPPPEPAAQVQDQPVVGPPEAPGQAPAEAGVAERGIVRGELESAERHEAIRAILGLVVLFALAYIGGRPKVQLIERRLGVSQVVAAGFPFVVLGVAASHPTIGVLSERVLQDIGPILPLGLGWIGFAAGFRFDARLFEELPASTFRIVAMTSLVPLAVVVAACSALLLMVHGNPRDATFLRDALLLGSAAMLTSRSVPLLLRSRGADLAATSRMLRIVQLQDLMALIGLLLVSSFFRPESGASGWQLPGLAWLFVAIGMAGALSALIYASLGQFGTRSELAVVLLGSVSLIAGLSSHLHLSPLAVCFLAGVVLSNFPSHWRDEVRGALNRLERPIYLLFLVIAGALWGGSSWNGWVLLGVFVLGRLLGKSLGVGLANRGNGDLSEVELRLLRFAPMGPLSIAIVVNAQDLYSGPTIPGMVTAVIGGAFLSEIIGQLAVSRSFRPRTAPVPVP